MTTPASPPPLPALTAASPVSPEDHVLFRLGQLLLLLRELPDSGTALDRLGYYDFFAANPFIALPGEDAASRARLHLAGFDERQLSYASPGARFANRRRRLQHDLALLVAYGLAVPVGAGYRLTDRGGEIASGFTALYADAYASSARIIVGQLSKLSDTALSGRARDWLREPALILDLYGAPESDEDAM